MVRTVRDCEYINLLQSFVANNEEIKIYNRYTKSDLKISTFRTFKADQPFYSENTKWQICNFPQIVRHYKGGMIWENAGEFLYKIKKEDKIIPVHTVALYCGMERGEENFRQAIGNLMKNLKLSSVQALEALGIPQNEWEKYMQV